MSLSRRALLLALPAAGVLGACRAIWSDDELAERLVAATVWKRPWPWRRLGKAYLEANPAARDRRRLIGELARRIGWWHLARPAGLRPRIRERIRDDFRTGRTTLVAGWVLSETEVRLAALVAVETAGG